MLQEGGAIPAIVGGDLGQEETGGGPSLDEKAMFSHLDLFNVGDFSERREDRDLDFEILSFIGCHGAESRVPKGCRQSHFRHHFGQRAVGGQVSDATPQFAVFLEGDKGAPHLFQTGGELIGSGERGAEQLCFDAVLGNLAQKSLFLGVEAQIPPTFDGPAADDRSLGPASRQNAAAM